MSCMYKKGTLHFGLNTSLLLLQTLTHPGEMVLHLCVHIESALSFWIEFVFHRDQYGRWHDCCLRSFRRRREQTHQKSPALYQTFYVCFLSVKPFTVTGLCFFSFLLKNEKQQDPRHSFAAATITTATRGHRPTINIT